MGSRTGVDEGWFEEKKGRMAKAAARVRKSWKDPAATLIFRVLGT